MISFHRSLALVALLFVALTLPSARVSAGSRGTSVTTTLNHGVTCTTSTTVIDSGVSPANSKTWHAVQCNVAVGRIHVNAAQSNETTGTYYGATSTCYNTNYCTVYISDKRYEQGDWLMDTSGIVGTTANHSYYGITQNANKWVYCYNLICSY